MTEVKDRHQRNILDVEVVLLSLLLSGGTLGGYRFYSRFLRPIQKATDIPKQAFHKQTLLGKVVSVGDGDNFHFFHTPGGVIGGWHWLRFPPKTNQRGANKHTLHIRLCGVDAPERSHFGKPAQPFSDEALFWLRRYILGRRIRVKPLALDQYGRVVAKAVLPTLWGRKNVSLEMIKSGYGVVYEAKSGAEFDGEEKLFRKHELNAKRAKRGLWSAKHIQTPGEYKKLYK